MVFQKRMCYFTKRPISHTDNSSVQLTFAELDGSGRITNKVKIYDVSGELRREGRIDYLIYEEMCLSK